MTNVETFKKPDAIYYPSVFMFRRLLLALTITFLKFNLVAQVLFAVNSSLLMLCWLIVVWPFDMVYKNYLECSNEFLVLMMSYLGFWFSDFVASPVTRSKFGYIYLGLIAAGLLTNVIFMAIYSVKDAIAYFRIRKLKQEHAARMKAKEEELEKKEDGLNIEF